MSIGLSFDPGALYTGILQSRAQAMANQVAWRNLFEQQRMNREILDLQKAGRTDAYGNRLEYVPGLGWLSRPTPTTKSLMDAEQAELRRGLLEDAPRNRAAAVRQDKRSQQADELYRDAVNNYKYRPEQREGTYVADAVEELLRGRQMAKSEASNVLARQVARSGGSPQNVSRIYQDAVNGTSDDIIQLLLQGKRLGKAEYRADQETRDAPLLRDLDMWRSVANDVVTSPVNSSGHGQNINRGLEGALADLTGAMQGAQRASSSAYGQLLQQLGQSPSFRGSGSVSFNSSAFPGGGKDTSYGDPWLEPWGSLRGPVNSF